MSFCKVLKILPSASCSQNFTFRSVLDYPFQLCIFLFLFYGGIPLFLSIKFCNTFLLLSYLILLSFLMTVHGLSYNNAGLESLARTSWSQQQQQAFLLPKKLNFYNIITEFGSHSWYRVERRCFISRNQVLSSWVRPSKFGARSIAKLKSPLIIKYSHWKSRPWSKFFWWKPGWSSFQWSIQGSQGNKSPLNFNIARK